MPGKLVEAAVLVRDAVFKLNGIGNNVRATEQKLQDLYEEQTKASDSLIAARKALQVEVSKVT